MSIFWKRKQNIAAEKKAEKASEIEVNTIKRDIHRKADQANKDIKKLNTLLRADGITLQIYTITGGRHGR